jgi:excisionase family DNA binding protein
VADRLNVTARYVLMLAASGDLRSVRIGRKAVRFRAEDVEETQGRNRAGRGNDRGACHQRRTHTIGEWIVTAVCHEVPHRQFVFTIPRVLRGIFRKRRHLLTLLFHTATSTLQDAFRIRLGLPHGRIGAIAGVHTSQEKITWNAASKTVIYRSSRSWRTKRNFEIFTATDFLAAAIEHIPPKNRRIPWRPGWERSASEHPDLGEMRPRTANSGPSALTPPATHRQTSPQ